MKNLITGTSTEVTWPQATQLGAMSFLLGIQVQAEILNRLPFVICKHAAPFKSSPICSTCSDAGSLTFPKPYT